MVVSAQAPPEALFPEGENSAEFQRAASRLHEMQSARYLQSERRRASGETAGKIQGVQAH
jgi:cell division protein ZapE